MSAHYVYKLALKDEKSISAADKIIALNEGGIEWSPLASGPVEWFTAKGSPCSWTPQDGCTSKVDSCKPDGTYFNDRARSKRMCDTDDIIDTVKMTNNRLEGRAKAKYLMMWNEPYLSCDSTQCTRGWMEPKHAVDAWRKHFAPAAKALGLDLVSMTFKGDEPKYQKWAADVLAQCYQLRNEANYPCDIFSIKKLSVHGYQCSEYFWNDYYSAEGPYFWKDDLKSKIKDILGADYDEAVFAEFFDTRKVWLTEFSCAADGQYNGRYPNGFKDPYPYGSAPYADQCRRASGQEPASHGKGVFKTLATNPEFERMYWFGLVTGCNHGATYVGSGNAVITPGGDILPPGQLLMASYNELSHINCTMPDVDVGCDGNGGSDNPDQGL